MNAIASGVPLPLLARGLSHRRQATRVAAIGVVRTLQNQLCENARCCAKRADLSRFLPYDSSRPDYTGLYGSPRQALRVPTTATREIPFDWALPSGEVAWSRI